MLADMGDQVPIVDYLVLDDGAPYLTANVCEGCGALYLDRRNACAKCGKTVFAKKKLAGTGTLKSFTIVHRAAPTVPVPYVSAVVHLDGGGTVHTNIVNVEPEPEAVRLNMPVRMTTYTAGVDTDGTEAVAFGFEPQERA
jgi:uncharacterized OB-fold protein